MKPSDDDDEADAFESFKELSRNIPCLPTLVLLLRSNLPLSCISCFLLAFQIHVLTGNNHILVMKLFLILS